MKSVPDDVFYTTEDISYNCDANTESATLKKSHKNILIANKFQEKIH